MELSPAPSLRQLIREDFVTHNRRPLSPGFHALAVHRLGRAAAGDRSLRGRLRWNLFRVARVLVVNLYGIELPPDVQVGRRVHLPHAQGVVAVPGSVIGNDCMLRHNVTLGVAAGNGEGRPNIGDRVQFGPGAMVLGGVSVGDDALVGPGALVIEDVPAGFRALAPVAEVRPPKTQWGRRLTRVDLREARSQVRASEG
ncbi:serine O-acetyltransferase [Kineococcus xinjiangensis]|uniref:Serine O-acetyltransferase n=1 Tax=Kineococcus xinjiangensis TaxID=512762 RepID=A0A2S6ISM4_9ACTN|nr:hypothetical protein [Kineococcus xinjiangensis]PPK97247.1 serine O-acetyltransferase [Kineococcus xinjiangensis]